MQIKCVCVDAPPASEMARQTRSEPSAKAILSLLDQMPGAGQPLCDRKGCDRKGCDRKGCDRKGCDRKGCDRKGCDRKGCDRKGCDRKGCDRKGCDRKGCDRKGCDRKGVALNLFEMLANALDVARTVTADCGVKNGAVKKMQCRNTAQGERAARKDQQGLNGARKGIKTVPRRERRYRTRGQAARPKTRHKQEAPKGGQGGGDVLGEKASRGASPFPAPAVLGQSGSAARRAGGHKLPVGVSRAHQILHYSAHPAHRAQHSHAQPSGELVHVPVRC